MEKFCSNKTALLLATLGAIAAPGAAFAKDELKKDFSEPLQICLDLDEKVPDDSATVLLLQSYKMPDGRMIGKIDYQKSIRVRVMEALDEITCGYSFAVEIREPHSLPNVLGTLNRELQQNGKRAEERKKFREKGPSAWKDDVRYIPISIALKRDATEEESFGFGDEFGRGIPLYGAAAHQFPFPAVTMRVRDALQRGTFVPVPVSRTPVRQRSHKNR